MRHSFLRTSSFETDPYFKNVALLLDGDGTNGGQNNTFLDSSPNNFTITRNGNVTQGSFSPYGNRWSNHFDGTGDYLSISANSTFAFRTSDFTVECFFYPLSNDTTQYLYILDSTGGFSFGFEPVSSVPSFVLGRRATAYDLSAAYTIVPNQWVHLAVCRSGGVVSLFINGARVATGSNSLDYTINGPVIIGGISTISGYDANGYISNLRVIKGTALYDPTKTTLSVPVSTLSAVTHTSLLTCQSNRFKDNSLNNFTITPSGNASVQRFDPFVSSNTYSIENIGGSAYFDGSGDFLTAPSNTAFEIGSGQFTLECWLYFKTVTNIVEFLWAASTSYVNGQLVMYYSSTSPQLQIVGYGGAGSTIAYVTLYAGQWYHLAASRDSSNNQRIFINGVLAASQVRTQYYSQNGFGIGRTGWTNTAVFNGYMSDVRLVKGSAVYTASFDPPTKPLTAVANTSLLCNFTNGQIIDKLGVNHLETFGTAQINSSIKKYAAGSIYFDGTGDYLTMQNNPRFSFGTNSFTIEAWVYIAANSTPDNGGNRTAAILGCFPTTGTISNSYGLFILGSTTTTGTGVMFQSYQSGTAYAISATTTVTQSTWHHIAVSRSGTTTRIFLNGIQVGSGTLGNQTVNSGYSMTVGRIAYTGYLNELNGYVDDLRITNESRYIANFTPPVNSVPRFF